MPVGTWAERARNHKVLSNGRQLATAPTEGPTQWAQVQCKKGSQNHGSNHPSVVGGGVMSVCVCVICSPGVRKGRMAAAQGVRKTAVVRNVCVTNRCNELS